MSSWTLLASPSTFCCGWTHTWRCNCSCTDPCAFTLCAVCSEPCSVSSGPLDRHATAWRVQRAPPAVGLVLKLPLRFLGKPVSSRTHEPLHYTWLFRCARCPGGPLQAPVICGAAPVPGLSCQGVGGLCSDLSGVPGLPLSLPLRSLLSDSIRGQRLCSQQNLCPVCSGGLGRDGSGPGCVSTSVTAHYFIFRPPGVCGGPFYCYNLS